MPNIGSWDGRWSGSESKHYIVESISDKYLKSKNYFKKLLETGKDSWHYSFGDGWGADVTAQIIDSAEAKKRRKASVGFFGYDWMVKTIKHYGEPMNTLQVKQHLLSQNFDNQKPTSDIG